MAVALPGVHVTTLELDPVHVAVARVVVALSGEADRVDVWTGHSKHLLSRIAAGRAGSGLGRGFGAIFMDRWGSQYTDDLDLLEAHGLLAPDCVLVADNVLRTCAPLFLWRVAGDGSRYRSQIARVREFAVASEDWMSVSVAAARAQAAAAAAPPPPEALRRLHAASERMRERAIGPGRSVALAERDAFAAAAEETLGGAGIAVSALADPGHRGDAPSARGHA